MRKLELIDIHILEVLEKHANAECRLTQGEIIQYLESEHDLKVHRNTVGTYLNALRENGYIEGKHGVYKINKFNDHELRLLIDGVLFGQHIPTNDATILIEKLRSMSEPGLKNRATSVCYLENINRTQNDNLYEMLDNIDEAIQNNKQIKIKRCKYNTDKQLVPTGKEYVVDPYYLVTEKSRYYLICYVNAENGGNHGTDLENWRIDRFSSVDILDTRRRQIRDVQGYSNGFELDKYMKEHIYMWSGKSVKVTLRIKTYAIGDFIDWFGDDFLIRSRDDEFMEVSIHVNENAIKYWALQYGEVATVLKPDKVRADIREALNRMQQNYQES